VQLQCDKTVAVKVAVGEEAATAKKFFSAISSAENEYASMPAYRQRHLLCSLSPVPPIFLPSCDANDSSRSVAGASAQHCPSVTPRQVPDRHLGELRGDVRHHLQGPATSSASHPQQGASHCVSRPLLLPRPPCPSASLLFEFRLHMQFASPASPISLLIFMAT